MKVSYLLGAGASALALPVVANMNDRFDRFNKYLSETFNDLPKANSLAASILDGIKEHATVDTYAKKLFLQDSEVELLELKFYLSLFFIFEQSGFYYQHFQDKTQENIVENKRYRNDSVDPRYDPFLASLLNKTDGGLVLPNNVNIISWNYDSQLELAYMPFAKCDIDEALSKLNAIPPNEQGNSGSSFVKMNGTAALLQNKDGKHFNAWRDYQYDLHEDFRDQIEKFSEIKTAYKIDMVKEMNKPTLNFAWEKYQPNAQRSFVEAKRIMTETDILVIIGYTFPNFNREIDRAVLGRFSKKGRKIYYQSRKKELDGLTTRLRSILPSEIAEKIEIIPYYDLNQFCIPLEL